MKRSYLLESVGLLITGIFCAFWVQSCKTQSMAMSKPAVTQNKPLAAIFFVQVPVDTAKQHRLTEAQKQAMLDKFGSTMVNRYVAPQFDKMVASISRLSVALDTSNNNYSKLFSLFSNYRIRSVQRNDSITKADNIHKRESDLKSDSIYRLQILLNKSEIKRDRLDSLRDAQQAVSIATNERLINYIWLYNLVLGLLVVGLIIFLKILWKKVLKIERNSSSSNELKEVYND